MIPPTQAEKFQWASEIQKMASPDGVKRTLAALNQTGPGISRASVIVACCQILATEITLAADGDEGAGITRTGIIALMDGFAMERTLRASEGS